MDNKLKLYTTLGCHLCDNALALINDYNLHNTPLVIEEVEISESDVLIERYGIRIPVIQFSSGGNELGWPFDKNELELFIRENVQRENS